MSAADANAFVPPNPEELEAIASLKERVLKDIPNPSLALSWDSTFMRFYRGAKRKEDVAHRELLRHDEWRREHHADEITTLQKDRIERVEALRLCVFLHDKARRPSSYVFVRKHKSSERDLDDFRAFIIHSMERLLREADPVEQRGIIVMDLRGFSLSNMDYELVKILLSIVQVNYPETLHRILIVDAPLLFSACWTVIRPWVDPVTAAKIEFIARSRLTDFFNAEEIPTADE